MVRPTPTVTGVVEKRANAYLADGLKGVARMDYAGAQVRERPRLRLHHAYVADLGNVVDLDRSNPLKIIP